MTSKEAVRCRACGRMQQQVHRSEIAEEDRAHYELCRRRGARDGFVPTELTNDEVLRALPVCIEPETPREAGIAGDLPRLSDKMVIDWCRKNPRRQQP